MTNVYDSNYCGLVPLNQQTFVSKTWGYERWLWNSDKYCGKVLFVAAGRFCSWHYHLKKDETFYLQSGQVLVYYGYDDDIKNVNQIILDPGAVFHIPTGLRHRFYAFADSYIYEFSTQHFDEDSIRLPASLPG